MQFSFTTYNVVVDESFLPTLLFLSLKVFCEDAEAEILQYFMTRLRGHWKTAILPFKISSMKTATKSDRRSPINPQTYINNQIFLSRWFFVEPISTLVYIPYKITVRSCNH